jgi:hypothetical protein
MAPSTSCCWSSSGQPIQCSAVLPLPQAEAVLAFLVRRHRQRLLVEHDPGGRRLVGRGQRHADLRVRPLVEGIDEIHEADRALLAFGQGHVEVIRIHDAAQRAMHGADESGDIGTAGGQLPDLEQHRLDRFQANETVFHQFP